jgi:hypothetical protein
MSYPQVVVLSCSTETRQCYPEETMVHVWFSGPPSDLSLCGAWRWVETLGQQRVSFSALPRASESALAGYPGLANLSGKERIIKHRYSPNSNMTQIYVKKNGLNQGAQLTQSALENFNMVGN